MTLPSSATPDQGVPQDEEVAVVASDDTAIDDTETDVAGVEDGPIDASEAITETDADVLAPLAGDAVLAANGEDCVPQPYGERDIFLRGGFNGWAPAADFRFVYKCDRYEALIEASGSHEFKVADDGWAVANFGGSGTVPAGTPTPLVFDGGNLHFTFSGTHWVVLDVSESTTSPSLTISTCPATPPLDGAVRLDLPGISDVRAKVIDAAEILVADQQGEAFGHPYAPEDYEYAWGSNSAILSNQVILATAFDLTGDARYSDAVVEGLDYLLGRNVLGLSCVTGYGSVYAQNQHSRWYANQLDGSLPHPPAGTVSGGPNSGLEDPVAAQWLRECVGQWCYVDHINAWSVNELTINWSSVLAWVAAFASDHGEPLDIDFPPSGEDDDDTTGNGGPDEDDDELSATDAGLVAPIAVIAGLMLLGGGGWRCGERA